MKKIWDSKVQRGNYHSISKESIVVWNVEFKHFGYPEWTRVIMPSLTGILLCSRNGIIWWNHVARLFTYSSFFWRDSSSEDFSQPICTVEEVRYMCYRMDPDSEDISWQIRIVEDESRCSEIWECCALNQSDVFEVMQSFLSFAVCHDTTATSLHGHQRLTYRERRKNGPWDNCRNAKHFNYWHAKRRMWVPKRTQCDWWKQSVREINAGTERRERGEREREREDGRDGRREDERSKREGLFTLRGVALSFTVSLLTNFFLNACFSLSAPMESCSFYMACWRPSNRRVSRSWRRTLTWSRTG